MPIELPFPMPLIDRRAFAEIAYRVMGIAFGVREELGSLVDERIYQRAIASQLPDARVEVPIQVRFGDFTKKYCLDLVVASSAIFEFKAVERISSRHRAQLLNYLLLAELGHGKLINLRPSQIQHEFINTELRLNDRRDFEVFSAKWRDSIAGEYTLRNWFTELVRDVGTSLDRELYREAANSFYGSSEPGGSSTDVILNGVPVGSQSVDMIAPNVALSITTLPPRNLTELYDHLQKFLSHTRLVATQSINITRGFIHFHTISK